MMQEREPERIALLHDGIPYTYGELTKMAEKLSYDPAVFSDDSGKGHVHIIRRNNILDQLLEFFACSNRNLVPVIVPYDSKEVPGEEIAPEHACMGVMTSGTSGKPKLLFRRYESWADFFPVQNEIFHVRKDSRLFAQGSLAFTGNLNIYLAQFFAGATIVAQNRFDPRQWAQVIEKECADMIYLIPSKLKYLLSERKNDTIKMIVSGSESLGKEEAKELKRSFPNARILLYYGASELSYITYITDEQMSSEKNLVGKPFPGVSVFIKDEKIFVDTPYHAEGISCPCTLSDKGYLDENGDLHFQARREDLLEIHGRKFSAAQIERECNQIEMIKESAVLLVPFHGKRLLTAFVRLEKESIQMQQGRFLGEIRKKELLDQLKERLARFEVPDRMVAVCEMPRNESGKIDKKKLEMEWGNGI